MSRTWLTAVAVSALAAIPAPAGVKMERVQAAHGRLGPERKGLDVQPQEEVLFRYLLTGLEADPDGKARGELRVTVTDRAGRRVLSRKSAVEGLLVLGGGTLPGFASVRLPDTAAPGVYTVTVTYTGGRPPRAASFRRTLTLKPVAFALVNPRFFYDPEGKVDGPAGGLVGQELCFRLNVVGHDRTRGRVDARMGVQVLDAHGEEVMPRPIRSELRNDDPAVVKEAATLTFTGQMTLTRPGKFTLRITVTDRVGGRTARFEAPLTVTEP